MLQRQQTAHMYILHCKLFQQQSSSYIYCVVNSSMQTPGGVHTHTHSYTYISVCLSACRPYKTCYFTTKICRYFFAAGLIAGVIAAVVVVIVIAIAIFYLTSK